MHRESDAAAWERPPRDEELFVPERRDIYNFIDETKVTYLRPFLPASGAAVEVGAGSGRLLIRLGRERPYRLVAVDYAGAALRTVAENARRGAVDVRLVRADARALPFAEGAFAIVLSGGLLEHFRDPESVVREQVRVLVPGGLFYADIVPRKVSLYRWAERGRMAHDEHLEPGIFESDRSKREWRELLRACGLDDVRLFTCGVFPPYTMRGYDRWTWRLAPLVRMLDGTPLADRLGFYYFCVAAKPA